MARTRMRTAAPMSFGSRMRSVLGGDDLDGGADELPVATMMVTLILGGDDLDGGVDELPAATPISLSLSPLFKSVKCCLKVKQLWKWFYGCEGVFYGQSVKHFQFGHIFSWCQTHNGVKCFLELVFM